MEKVLNATGKVCPFPLIEAKEAIEEISSGNLLTIHFDCVQATENIPRWAAEAGHQVTNFEQVDEGVWTITLQKK